MLVFCTYPGCTRRVDVDRRPALSATDFGRLTPPECYRHKGTHETYRREFLDDFSRRIRQELSRA